MIIMILGRASHVWKRDETLFRVFDKATQTITPARQWLPSYLALFSLALPPDY